MHGWNSPDHLPNVLADLRNRPMHSAAHQEDASNAETQVVPVPDAERIL